MARRRSKEEPLLVEGPEGGRGRAFWSGTVSFGLVTVPVEMYAAQRVQRISLRTLGPDGSPLGRRYYGGDSDKPLERESVERGYALDDGKIIPLSDEELEALLPEQSRDIDLRAFVPAERIDPGSIDRAYFLLPTGGNTLAYRLLAEVMARTDKVGIATFVMRAKQYLVAIESEDGILRAQTLRFADELRTPKDIGLPHATKVQAALLKQAQSELRKLKKPQVAPAELRDEQREKLEQLVEKKRKAGKDVIAAPDNPSAPAAGEAGQVIDLLEVLRNSLAKDRESRPNRAAARKPGRSTQRTTRHTS